MTGHFVQGSQFYLTAPAPCPYLPHRRERKVFTHLSSGNACHLNDMLSRHGFRRSQAIAYRPACEACSACMSLRVDSAGFRQTSSMRRVRNANADLRSEWRPARATSEQYSLFRRYLDDRHLDGGMSGMTVLDYAMMVEDSHVRTEMVEYRMRSGPGGQIDGGEDDLVAVALTDRLEDGLSLVYSFYDPDLPKRSLGTFVILDHIERARAAGLPYVYLGYWVEGSRKMDYKIRFRPHERLTPRGWERFD